MREWETRGEESGIVAVSMGWKSLSIWQVISWGRSGIGMGQRRGFRHAGSPDRRYRESGSGYPGESEEFANAFGIRNGDVEVGAVHGRETMLPPTW